MPAAKAGSLEGLAAHHEVPFARLGETGDPRMVFDDLFEATVEECRRVHESAIPALMSRRAAAG